MNTLLPGLPVTLEQIRQQPAATGGVLVNSIDVIEPGHSMTVGLPVYPLDGDWLLSYTTPEAAALGIIADVQGDTYTVCTGPGVITWPAHGYPISVWHYLGDSPGSVTDDPNALTFTQLLFVPITENTVHYFAWAPMQGDVMVMLPAESVFDDTFDETFS